MKPVVLFFGALFGALFCVHAFAGCSESRAEVLKANEELRMQVFNTHPPHPIAALTLADLKRSDELLADVCSLAPLARNEALRDAGLAHYTARTRLAGKANPIL